MIEKILDFIRQMVSTPLGWLGLFAGALLLEEGISRIVNRVMK